MPICFTPFDRSSDSKGPNRVSAAIILPEDGNTSSFRNVVFLKIHLTVYSLRKHDYFKLKETVAVTDAVRCKALLSPVTKVQVSTLPGNRK
jgi:hypothetical protein